MPTRQWSQRALVAVAALCAVQIVVRAQTDAAAASDAQPSPIVVEDAAGYAAQPQNAEVPSYEAEGRVDEAAPDGADPAAPVTDAAPRIEERATADEDTAPLAEPSDALAAEPAFFAEGAEPVDATAEPGAPSGISNADVQSMVEAEFSDATIIAVIGANAVAFDLSPRALVALNGAGVSEEVIAAMIEAEEAANVPEEIEPTSAELAETQASIEYARLTEMIEQLAEQQEEALQARRAPEPPESRASTPRVWLIQEADRTAIAPTIAQVAITGGNSRRGERMKNLQGLANQALAFANPAVSGIASTLGSLFRPDEEGTAVWALASTQSSRVLDFAPVFEIDFAQIPGVDPDRYQPSIVQLVPTKDNYRLVAAAETDGASTGALPRGPIIEEDIDTERTRLGRGQYRVAPKTALGPGEYALVLRPIAETKRARRRDREASLGELLGGSTSQILYLTWEFSIAA